MRRFLVAATGALALMAGTATAFKMCDSGPRVTCVVDGDTFWLHSEKIRAVGYDTSEAAYAKFQRPAWDEKRGLPTERMKEQCRAKNAMGGPCQSKSLDR